MRIIKKRTLVEYWERHPQAKAGLVYWHKQAKAAKWSRLQDVRKTFSHADPVMVRSRRRVVVFNISGNRYRLMAAIHYNLQRIYVLMILTHREYDSAKWREVL